MHQIAAFIGHLLPPEAHEAKNVTLPGLGAALEAWSRRSYTSKLASGSSHITSHGVGEARQREHAALRHALETDPVLSPFITRVRGVFTWARRRSL